MDTTTYPERDYRYERHRADEIRLHHEERGPAGWLLALLAVLAAIVVGLIAYRGLRRERAPEMERAIPAVEAPAVETPAVETPPAPMAAPPGGIEPEGGATPPPAAPQAVTPPAPTEQDALGEEQNIQREATTPPVAPMPQQRTTAAPTEAEGPGEQRANVPEKPAAEPKAVAPTERGTQATPSERGTTPAPAERKAAAPAERKPAAAAQQKQAAPAAEAARSTTAPAGCQRIDLYFAASQTELTPQDRIKLDKFALCLRQNPDVNVRLEGRTDGRESTPDDGALAQNRAHLLADELMARGVSSSQLRIVFGPRTCAGDSQNCLRQNRSASGIAD